MVRQTKNLVFARSTNWISVTTFALTLALNQAASSFLPTAEGPSLPAHPSCDTECMSYCLAYYPTSGCLETCECPPLLTERTLYPLPRENVLSLAVAPVALPSLTAPPIVAAAEAKTTNATENL